MTPHGFIEDSDKSLKAYKNDHAKEWAEILGGGNFDIVEETETVAPEVTYEQEPN